MLKHCLVALILGLVVAAVPATATSPLVAEATAADFVADVVGPYLAIQTALVNDDLAPVTAAAKSLQKGAGALGAEGEALAAAAAKAASAKTIEAARTAFGDLSTALIAYADTTKQPIEGKIVAFCPMVNKSWVQADGTIANPYYGKAMSTCGSSTRKLSATH
jgi:hypothetical protein